MVTDAEIERKSILCYLDGTTSVISEQSCYTVASAYRDIVMQSCASEPASDLSLRNSGVDLDNSPGLRDVSQLVACHACARSVATFEAYPSFCTGVQKSANHLFCSRSCRRKYQVNFFFYRFLLGVF